MKIKKLTDLYTLIEEGNKYVLNYGVIKKSIPVTTKFRFTETDGKTFTVVGTCGCQVVNNTKIDDTTYETNITYNAGNDVINKTIVITNGKERKELKLTGQTKL